MANSKGFSLVEVVVSMLLVALVMVPLLASVVQSSVFSERIDMTYKASLIAQRRIELLKGFEVGDLADIAAESNIGIDVDEDGTIDYRRSTSITEDFEGVSDLVKVTVTVEKADFDMSGKQGDMGAPIIMETVFYKGFEDD